MDTPDGVGHCRDQNAREAGEPFSETLADTDMWGSGLAQSGAARQGTARVRRQRCMGRRSPVTEHLHRMVIRTAGTCQRGCLDPCAKNQRGYRESRQRTLRNAVPRSGACRVTKQEICYSRIFGKRLLDLELIKEAVAAYAARPARSCGRSRPCASASESASASACSDPVTA